MHLPPLLHRPRRTTARATLLGLTFAGVVACAGSATGDPASAAWIPTEIERLRAVATALGDEGQSSLGALDDIARDFAAGRPHLATARVLDRSVRLEALAEARTAHAAMTSAAGDDDATAVDDAVARRLAADREAIDRLRLRLAEVDGPTRPALHRALAAAADNRADALLAGGRGFAAGGDAFGGLYYASRGRRSTAAAVALLEHPAAATGPPLEPRGLDELLADLERRTTEAYRRPDAEIEQHSRFIALNATLKEARELLADSRGLGALVALLEAERDLGEINDSAGHDAGADAGVETFDGRLDAAATRYGASDRDASIALYFVEQAASALDPADEDSMDVGRARAVLDHVLPLYDRLVAPGS